MPGVAAADPSSLTPVASPCASEVVASTCSSTGASPVSEGPVRFSPRLAAGDDVLSWWDTYKMLRDRSAILGISIVIAAVACTGPRSDVVVKADPKVDFRAFKTFAFVPAEHLEMEGSQMRDPVTRRNIETAIARELQARGLSPTASGQPDLFVGYFADVYQGTDRMRPIDPNTGHSMSARQGELTVHLIDAQTQQVVWRGEAWLRDPSFKRAENVVADLFRLYPPKR